MPNQYRLTTLDQLAAALQAASGKTPTGKTPGTGKGPQTNSMKPADAVAAVAMNTTMKTQEASAVTEKDQKLVHAAVKEADI
ncbi:hypothetical protein BVC80_8883g11 [Macleaya cordata]|uniref:Uncharacterized protein n=1 Tax=Macleaya cordata TaxID=56857 RepID=A0A200Q7D7_MACCD|nr:hypothetical protein BVC80_8883g11 [Macleaya cordata]